MVEFIQKGDIFTIAGICSYAHGCNCAGAMGKGIALQFRERYPEMYTEYKHLCRYGLFNPGDVFDYDYGNGHIYNLATQQSWRSKVKMEYVETALNKMLDLALSKDVTGIALPAIGAGLGGLCWENVKSVIEAVSLNYSGIDLFVVEKYCPSDV